MSAQPKPSMLSAREVLAGAYTMTHVLDADSLPHLEGRVLEVRDHLRARHCDVGDPRVSDAGVATLCELVKRAEECLDAELIDQRTMDAIYTLAGELTQVLALIDCSPVPPTIAELDAMLADDAA